MADRDKVINAINICLGKGHCDDCGYRIKGGYSTMDCRKPMLRDALALLKEQEARVLTLDEFITMGEPLDGESICYEIRRGDGSTELTTMLVKCFGNCRNLYNGAFRVWTSRPTDEQRKAVKWE